LKAVLVRPKFDDVTPYTFAFAAEILQWCQEAGISVVDLAEGEAIRARVEEELQKGFDLFIHYDHGDETALIGQDEKAVIDLSNCDFLKDKETYTLACLSAKSLGAEVWRRGGKYWGYVEVVSFTTDALPAFQESFNCGFKFRFIEGNSHQDALARAKETFDDLAVMLVDAGNIFAAICMRQNRDSLRYYNANTPEEGGKGCLLALLKLPKLLLNIKRRNEYGCGSNPEPN
jgi:hypothetical protein